MLRKIIIDKFKGINHIEIEPSKNFNVIIGENNIGKTTIFEAIHLWKMCYDYNIKKDRNGFYSIARNMKFEDMECIRIIHDYDIFSIKDNSLSHENECTIILDIEYHSTIYSLGFNISKVTNIGDAYLQIAYTNPQEFKNFAEMVDGISGKNLSTFIAINESKPIPHIIAKEPYMYKDQVRDKIAKGKNNEVLRNKIIMNMKEVQHHINNIMDSEYVFSISEKGKKNYISVLVDGKDIFSYGSGFLQLTEIFASQEFEEPEIYILLIDEPDAHLHLKLQKRLIDEFRAINNSQLFIITHNERFLNQVPENEILFLDDNVKRTGKLLPLPQGTKHIALENLKGCLEQLDKLKYAKKIIAVEGKGDTVFLSKMKPIYENLYAVQEPDNIIYIELLGIDAISSKLLAYSKALNSIIPDDCKWLVIRDTDFVPYDKISEVGEGDIQPITSSAKKIIFQNGYGIESTFASEPNKLSRMLAYYYNVTDESKIKEIILSQNIEFNRMAKDITNPDIYKELNKCFSDQKDRRGYTGIYQKLELTHTLKHISENKIQYIMTKKIMRSYLKAIHTEVCKCLSTNGKSELDEKTIFDLYYEWIKTPDDIFECHKTILDEIYDSVNN